MDTLDPFAPDDGMAGWSNISTSPAGTEMVYGLAVDTLNNRLIFGTFGVPRDENSQVEIPASFYEVSLGAAGIFTGSETLLNSLPTTGRDEHEAISDIAVLPDGRIMVGSRSTCHYASSYNHYGTFRIYNSSGSMITDSIAPSKSGSFRGEGNRDGYGGVAYCMNRDEVEYYLFSSSDLDNEDGPHGLLALDPDFTYTGFNGDNGGPVVVPGYIIPFIPNSTSGAGNDRKGMGADIEVLNECIPKPQPVQIGNYVWVEDININGVQDPCEPPLPNLPISLYSKTGVLLASTNSDANGNYLFSGYMTGDGATWSGQDTLQPDSAYFVVFGDAAVNGVITVAGQNYVLVQDSTGLNPNSHLNDSDPDMTILSTAIGSIPAGLPIVCITTPASGADHSMTPDLSRPSYLETPCSLTQMVMACRTLVNQVLKALP